MSAPEHAAPQPQSYSFYADLRRGVGYAFARRQKLLAGAVFLAGVLVSQHLVSGTAAWVCGVVLAVAGGGAINFAHYIAPPAKGPTPTERATERGLTEPAAPEGA